MTTGYTIRRPNDDRVFLVIEGRKHWIKNPFTLEKLGLTLGTEQTITQEEFNNLDTGPIIDLDNQGNIETNDVTVGDKVLNYRRSV